MTLPDFYLTPYQRHRVEWKNCERCELCQTRDKVVLVRGTLPAPVLFIGEAPGVSENTLGLPFVGPAGKLLDRIIDKANWQDNSYAITNLVGCIPLGEDGAKTAEPSKECIYACEPRLTQVLGLCQPKLIVCVGRLSTKYVPKLIGYRSLRNVDKVQWLDLIHPAAILRMDVMQQRLAIQRSIVALADALENLQG